MDLIKKKLELIDWKLALGPAYVVRQIHRYIASCPARCWFNSRHISTKSNRPSNNILAGSVNSPCSIGIWIYRFQKNKIESIYNRIPCGRLLDMFGGDSAKFLSLSAGKRCQ
jgi:hypothetical protein